jgi:hypothetical protein
MVLLRRTCLLTALMFLSLLSPFGCSDIQLEFGPAKPLPAKLMVVYPYRLRYEAPALKSFELAMDEVGVVLARKQLGVLGPDEFKILAADGQEVGIFSSTNVAGALPALGILPGNVVALRGWAERREQKFTTVRYDAQGKPEGQKRDVQVTMVAHLELLGPDSSNPLAEAKVEFQVDPFADHPLYDDTPELRKQVRRLTEQLLDQTRSLLITEPQPSDVGFDYLYNPRNAETFALPNRPAYAQQLMAMDPISRDAAITSLLLYFYPDLPASRSEQMQMLPTGLLVTAVNSPIVTMDGLLPNDLIVEVEQTPVAGPQTLLRFMARKDPGLPVTIGVLRGRARVSLYIPSPPR